jgi:dienelactone hydrolase
MADDTMQIICGNATCRLSLRLVIVGLLATATLAPLGTERVLAQAAPQRITGREFGGAVNLAKEDAHMQGFVFIPQAAARVRCLLVVIWQGLESEDFYFDAGVRRVAADSRCALALATLRRIEIQNNPSAGIASALDRNAAAGGGSALLKLVDQFAKESGHPELREAGMMFWGFSASASFGTTFAALYPERTIGVIRYHTHRRDLVVDLERIKSVPALLVAGGMDQTAGVDDAEQFWKAGRAAGAPWTFAVEPAASHSSQEIQRMTARDLTVPWIAAVLRQRLTGGRTLAAIDETQTWLSDTRTFAAAPYQEYGGDKRNANWLPDERVAQGWRTVVGATNQEQRR